MNIPFPESSQKEQITSNNREKRTERSTNNQSINQSSSSFCKDQRESLGNEKPENSVSESKPNGPWIQ